MLLLRVRKERFDVLAVCDAEWRCQVLDTLSDGSSASRQMMAHLKRAASQYPPSGTERFRQIHRKLGACEIKSRYYRAFCFRDGDCVICTHVMHKSQLKDKHYPAQEEIVLDHRARYLSDKKAGRLEIITDQGATDE